MSFPKPRKKEKNLLLNNKNCNKRRKNSNSKLKPTWNNSSKKANKIAFKSMRNESRQMIF